MASWASMSGFLTTREQFGQCYVLRKMWTCDLSHDATDKLKAVLASDLASTDKALPAKYLETCRFWFDDLTHSDRIVAHAVRTTYLAGHAKEAEDLAMKLPAAPISPS